MADSKQLFSRRKRRNRYRIKARSAGRPRLSVFRSNKHIYAQIIDDENGRTLAAASSREKVVSAKLKTGADIEAAKAVGELIAQRGGWVGVDVVVFDRGGYMYHGRIKALAEAAREGGLSF